MRFIVACISVKIPPKTPVLTGFEPAAIGSYRELVCDASQPGAGTITYKWYKYSIDGRTGVEDWESKGTIGTSQKYVFNPVTENVSGKYKCRATNYAGTRDSEWSDLYVYTSCSLYTVSVSPAKPAIGSTFTLSCYIPNPSGLTVNWLKKADTSSAAIVIASANSKGWSSCSRPRTFNLKVTSARPSDSAYWMCQDIILSCISNPVMPVVQAPPGTPQITGFLSGPVEAGTQLNLMCVASPSGDSYDWYKDGTKVTTSSTYDFQVTKESAGVYKCEARNDVGSATSSDKALVVYSKADSVVVSSGKTSSFAGEKDKFTCTVTGGSPTPTLKIYFKRSGGSPVEVTQGQDRVMVKEDNQAEYYCEAKVTGYAALDMTSNRKTYIVTFNPSKITMTHFPNTAIQEGQLITVICETDSANPVADIVFYRKRTGGTWEKLTSRITSEDMAGGYNGWIRKSTLTATANRLDTQAVFKCEVKEGSFQVEQTSTVNVCYKADSVVVSSGKTSSHVGEKDKFTCTVTGGSPTPTLKIYFKRSGGTPEEVTQGQDRVMAKEDNQAEFYCEAKVTGYPALDMTSSRKTFNVTFPPNGIQLSETSISVKEGATKTITCSTTSSSNPAVSDVSVKKKLASSEVEVTGRSRVTNGAYYGKDVSIDIRLDTNRRANEAQYICTFTHASTTFKETATVNVQFNPSKITMTHFQKTAIHEGQPITIICETDSANPVANIQFHRKREGGTEEKLTSEITSEARAGEYNGRLRKSTLTVTANRLDTQAVFKCEVKEGSFQDEQISTVNVYYPPTVKMSSNSMPSVKEGDTLALTCTASGGNPTHYTYKWFYENKEIPNETTKDYTITNIKYTQSGTYMCQAINYVPGGIVHGSLSVDILYKAKWNPEVPEVFTVASKINTPMKFVLHVIANPSPTSVTWSLPNKTAIDSNTFTAAKVNATTYTLSKLSLRAQDYGSYTVSVTNVVGISSFTFELQTVAPSVPTFTITRNGKIVTVVFGPLIKEYTGFQLRFCGPGLIPTTTGCSGSSFFFIRDPARTNYTIHVTHETTMYVFYLDLYDGDDVVYSSGPVQSRHAEETTAMPAGSGSNGGMIAICVVLAVVILVDVVVVVVVVLYRRNLACFSGGNKPEGSNHDDERAGTTRPGEVFHEPFYINVNRAFEGEQSSDDDPQQEKRVQEVVYDDAKLTDSQSGKNAARKVEGGDENPYDEMENPYADLNITPDVIASQTYAELKPWTVKQKMEKFK